jgi:LacI family transcriptional regulator
MNRKPDVGPETFEKVMAAVRKLDYRPNPIAANLARKHELKNIESSKFKTGAIGFLSAGPALEAYLNDEFQARYLRGIESVAGERNLDMLFASCGEQLKAGAMPKMIQMGQVDGVIIKSGGALPGEWIETLSDLLPTVIISGRYESSAKTVSSVMGDNAGAIRKALRYLIGLGHGKIAFLGVDDLGWGVNFDHVQRRNAFLEALPELGLALPEGFLQEPVRDHAKQGLDDVVSDALDFWLSLGAARPTAICCATDAYAVSLTKIARAKGVSLPEGLSVTGFMDVQAAALNDPPLTTMALPSGEMGKAAASLLLELIQNKGMAPRNVLIDCPLVERLSCARV